MIFRLLKRDSTLITLVGVPFFALLGWMNAVDLRSRVVAGQPPVFGITDHAFRFALYVGVFACLIYFFGSRMFEKATPWQMSLPIGARALWVARLVAVLLPFLGGVLVAEAAYVVAWGDGPSPVGPGIGFNLLAFSAAVPLVYYSGRVGVARWGMPLPLFMPAVAGLAWCLATVGLNEPVFGVLALGLAGVLGVASYLRTPAGYEMWVGSAAGRASLRLASITDALERFPPLRRLLRLDRMLRAPRWASLGQLKILAVLALVASVFGAFMSPFTGVLALTLLQTLWLARTLNGAARIGHLPVRAGPVFLHAILPPLALVAAVATAAFTFLPGPGWSLVPTLLQSKVLAVGAVIYVLTWWLVLSWFLRRLHRPSATTRWIRLRHLAEPRYWLAILLLARWALWRLGDHRAGLPGGAGFRGFCEELPVPSTTLWLLAAVAAVSLALWLHRDFRRVELAPLIKGVAS